MRKKSRLRFLTRMLSLFAILFGVALFTLWAKPLVAESLEPARYTAADAEKYIASPFSGPNFSAPFCIRNQGLPGIEQVGKLKQCPFAGN